jgi:hypothetical protein
MRSCCAGVVFFLAVAGCGKMPQPQNDLQGLLAGSPAAEPFGPLQAVAIGTLRPEAQAALDRALAAAPTWNRKWIRLGFELRERDGKVGVLDADFFNVNPEPVLTAVWGKPIRTRSGPHSAACYWFNRSRTMKVTLNDLGAQEDGRLGYAVRFTPYLPIDQLVGTGPKSFGFEKTPLLGATGKQLAQDYAEYLRPGPTGRDAPRVLELPPTEYDVRDYTPLTLALADGVVVGMELDLEYARRSAQKGALLEALRAKCGESRPPVEEAGGGPVSFCTDPQLIVSAHADEARIRVGLFGDDE